MYIRHPIRHHGTIVHRLRREEAIRKLTSWQSRYQAQQPRGNASENRGGRRAKTNIGTRANVRVDLELTRALRVVFPLE